MATLRDLENEMREAVEEHIRYLELDWESSRRDISNARDELPEQIDGVIPGYTSDLLEVFSDSPSLAFTEPDDSPSDRDVFHIAQRVLYEHLADIAYRYFDAIVDDFEEPEDEEEDEDEDESPAPASETPIGESLGG